MDRPMLKPVARSTVVETVAEQLRSEIYSGAFPVGTRLPSERDLAAQLQINRLTLRAALSKLEATGLIATQHGTGSVVQDYREHGTVETLAGLMRVARDGDPKLYLALARDLLELRRGMACEVVVLASERRTADDLAQMRRIAEAQKARVKDRAAFARGDMEFARTVVKAARNLGIELLMNSIGRFPDDDALLVAAMYPTPRAQARHYEVVIGLIDARAGAAAREPMREALDVIDRATLKRLSRQLEEPNASARKSVRNTGASR